MGNSGQCPVSKVVAIAVPLQVTGRRISDTSFREDALGISVGIKEVTLSMIIGQQSECSGWDTVNRVIGTKRDAVAGVTQVPPYRFVISTCPDPRSLQFMMTSIKMFLLGQLLVTLAASYCCHSC